MSSSLDLVFQPDDRAPLELVFGDDGGAGEAPAYSISGGGKITGLRRATATLDYDVNVPRPLLAWRRSAFEVAKPIGAAVRSAAQIATPLSVATRSRAEVAQPIGATVRSAFQRATPLSTTSRSVYEVARPIGVSTRSAFERATALSAAVRSRMQTGVPVQTGVRSPFEQALKLHHATRQGFQDGRPVAIVAHSSMSTGVPMVVGWRQRFQTARYPSPGATPSKPIDPRADWCYVPSDPIELVFYPDDRAPLDLLFECGPPVVTPGAIVIPTRSTYVVQNNVTFYRLPSGHEFEASNFNLDIDTDSWTFGWSASLPASARVHLVRTAPRERVRVECLVNGVALQLTIDGMGRDWSFPEDRISVKGRGLAAELDDATLSFGNTAARTAQQLMADVLTVNGVSIGWGVDWQIEDWLVPANAWLMQGTYIAALQDIAGAAGAYLQPHFTDKVLRVLPRYAKAPWDWATELAVDIELPVEATSVVITEEVLRPDYNRVFVGGVAMGVFGPVTRDGTAGETDAPPVSHPLITATEVHRQRGIAELSNTGLQVHHSLKTLVWPETGIIMPGKVLRYTSEDGPELGIVRRTNVNMSQWPVMHQTLGVETHVE